MASCITPSFGSSTSPQVKMTVELSSSTGNTATYTWYLDYVAHGYAASTKYKKAYTATLDGETVAEGTFAINGITGTARIASGTKTIAKANSSRTVSFSCSMAFNLNWGSTYGGTKSADGTFTVSGISTSTVSFNANGGTGAPSPQTKWYGTILTLSTVRPTRTGYSFLGWGTSASDTTVDYSPGDPWGSDTSATLYAIWRADTYQVLYNANGGSGAPSGQIKTYGVTLKLSSTKPTRTNYNFKGWGTSPSSSTVAYAAGANYTANAPITLYAIWELAYTAPRINGFTVDRCNSSGTLSESGTYALVKFSWATDKTVSTIKIERKQSTASAWSSTTVIGSGTSGSVSQVVGANALSTEYNYDIRVTVTDSLGSSDSTKTVFAMRYEMDLLKGGGGVAFGKPATRKGFDVGMPAYFGSAIFDRFGQEILNGMTKSETSGIDPDTTLHHAIVTHQKTPMGTGQYMYILTYFYGSKTVTSNRLQVAYPYDGSGSEYHRYYYGGKWSAWKKHVNEDEFLTAKPIFKLAYMKRSNCHIAASGNDWFTVANSLPAFSGYTLEGIMSYNNGFGDQFLVSYAVYGTKLLAYVKNYHPAELTFSLGCTLLYLRDDLKGQYYSEFTFNPA